MIHLPELVPRAAAARIGLLVREEPAVMIEGPRGSGKSTILRALVAELGGSVVDLDDPLVLAEIRAGAEGPLRSPSLIGIDEFQRAPEVLLAVKRVVDREGGAGRFLLAGSLSDRLLPRGTETLTGRVERVALLPLSAADILGGSSTWLGEVLDGAGSVPDVGTDLRRDVVFELVAAGGYPAALRRGSLAAQRRWLQSYLLSVADRDLREFVDVRNPGAVARLFALAAERTAQTVNMHEMGERLEIKPHTVRSYLTLLERCFLVQELPSWTVGLSASSAKRPKLHVIDTGLASASLRADASKLGKLAVGGPLVESFVVSEIRKQAVLLDEAVQLAHYRDAAGREVDLVVERSDGSVIGIEVKSSAGASAGDAKGLRFLRDALGDRFVCGVVLHTGPFTRRMEDRIWATPIPALWGGVGTTA